MTWTAYPDRLCGVHEEYPQRQRCLDCQEWCTELAPCKGCWIGMLEQKVDDQEARIATLVEMLETVNGMVIAWKAIAGHTGRMIVKLYDRHVIHLVGTSEGWAVQAHGGGFALTKGEADMMLDLQEQWLKAPTDGGDR